MVQVLQQLLVVTFRPLFMQILKLLLSFAAHQYPAKLKVRRPIRSFFVRDPTNQRAYPAIVPLGFIGD
jgi:hypothetical protein